MELFKIKLKIKFKIRPAKLFLIVFLYKIQSYATAYSFSDCIQLVQKNNSKLISAEQSYEAASSQMKSLYSGYLPHISAQLGYTQGQVDSVNNNGYSASLTATQNIFNGFSDQAKIKSAEGKVISAEANLRSVKAQLSYDLKTAFAGVMYADESLRLAKSILKRRLDNYSMVELRFKSGRENKGSVLLSKANSQQAQLDVLKAENALKTAQSNLIRVLGLAPDAEVSISDSVPLYDPEVSPDFKKKADSTPQHRDAEGKIQSAESSLEDTTSGFLPSLDLTGSVGKTGLTFFPNDSNRWSVGATLSWSLFDGGKDYFSRKSAMALKLVAESDWSNSYREILTSLRSAYSSYAEAVEQVKVSNGFVEAGSTRAEIGRSKYNNGLAAFDDWDRMETDLITYQKDQVVKRRDRITAEANWEQVQGVGVVP